MQARIKVKEQVAAAAGLKACIFVTLTAGKDDWDPRLAVSEYSEQIEAWAKSKGIPPVYEWVAEPQVQNECRIHWHVLVWVPRRHWRWHLPKPDTSGMWRHGSSEIAWARRPARYMAKYMGKTKKGATAREKEIAFRSYQIKWLHFRQRYGTHIRTYGGSRVRGLRERAWLAYQLLPFYVRRLFPFGTVIRAPKEGLVVKGDVGEFALRLRGFVVRHASAVVSGMKRGVSLGPVEQARAQLVRPAYYFGAEGPVLDLGSWEEVGGKLRPLAQGAKWLAASVAAAVVSQWSVLFDGGVA